MSECKRSSTCTNATKYDSKLSSLPRCTCTFRLSFVTAVVVLVLFFIRTFFVLFERLFFIPLLWWCANLLSLLPLLKFNWANIGWTWTKLNNNKLYELNRIESQFWSICEQKTKRTILLKKIYDRILSMKTTQKLRNHLIICHPLYAKFINAYMYVYG